MTDLMQTLIAICDQGAKRAVVGAAVAREHGLKGNDLELYLTMCGVATGAARQGFKLVDAVELADTQIVVAMGWRAFSDSVESLVKRGLYRADRPGVGEVFAP